MNHIVQLQSRPTVLPNDLCTLQPARPRISSALQALKRPSQLLPPTEDKSVQCIVETGIRGSLAMLAATALQIDVFSHLHWNISDAMTGLQLAAPCAAVDAGLLLMYGALSTTTHAPVQHKDFGTSSSLKSRDEDLKAAKAAVLAAIDAVNMHNIRYSLVGATSVTTRLGLEAGAQLSEELLARGVLLGCASTWLTNRLVEASLCGDQPLVPLNPLATLTSSSHAARNADLLSCGTAPEWLAAALLCCIMASRFVVHSHDKAAAARSARNTAAAEAAARRAVLRYEPLAVQQAAAAAAGGEVGSEVDAEAAIFVAAADEEAIARLAQGWLGARFVLGQACLFGAFIATDNLLASFVAGLAMQAVSSMCSERYLRTVTAA